MMTPVSNYVRQGRQLLRRWAVDPRVHTLVRGMAFLTAGFCLSAASLGNLAQPIAMGFVCACTGGGAALAALGSSLGYLFFWGNAGYQAVAWATAALVAALIVGDSRMARETPLLQPVLGGLLVAASGVVFQTLGMDNAPILLYILRVALGAASVALFVPVLRGRNPILDWIAWGMATLALAQIMPLPYLGLGYIAAGTLSVAGAFPAAALAGLALDLAGITRVPMTAAVCLGYLVRFLPRCPKWIAKGAPAAVYLAVMGLCGKWDLYPLPGLLLGGIFGNLLLHPGKATHRRGEIGVAQVRLELAAGVLNQTEQLLTEISETPVDEGALVARAAEQACGSCPCRKGCRDAKRISQLPGILLHKPLLHQEELPILCRKSGRFLAELHRSQEQLRSIRADRERQREYRTAVVQQYQFLSRYLQELSDKLSRRSEAYGNNYNPEVQVFGNRPEVSNGDRCLRFAGVGGNYYVLLCDGMGTGLGAVQEGKTAAELLRRMLCAGFPAEHALRSLNSLCALRDRAGAVTVDLAQIRLDTGKVTLYKWGAAPSYLISGTGAEKLGNATPPPGLSITDTQETTEQFSMRRGETLVMVSDGVGEETALRCCREYGDRPVSELARNLLSWGQAGGEDDATVVTVKLEAAMP